MKSGNSSFVVTRWAGIVGVAGCAAYVARKHAVIGFAKATVHPGRSSATLRERPALIHLDLIRSWLAVHNSELIGVTSSGK